MLKIESADTYVTLLITLARELGFNLRCNYFTLLFTSYKDSLIVSFMTMFTDAIFVSNKF